MSRRRTMLKMGLIGLAVLAVAGFAAAQALSVSDKVLLLQAKRFEGTFKLPGGETKLKVGDNDAEWSVKSGSTEYAAALAPKSGKPNRATLALDGRTVEGKAEIEAKTLTMVFVDDKTTYKITIVLSGRNEGKLTVAKDDKPLVEGDFTRAAA